MSDTTLETPTTAANDLFSQEKALPVIKEDMVSYEAADPATQLRIRELMQEIDIKDSNSIIFFGSKAQEQLTTVSDNMLEGVRNKDLGAAGDSLNDMITTLRGFDVQGLDPDKGQGFFAWLWSKMTGAARPVAKFIQEYEGVRKQIDGITDNLESHKTQLLTDIKSLDRLYEANLEYFHTLESYIVAGEQKLADIDSNLIPELEKTAASAEDVLTSQELRDVRAHRDDLERRVHDLKLTRQVAMQALPSIRLVQENDKGLVNKINSTLVNTVPLWRQQLAQAVTIFRSSEAAKSVKAATDLTNDLLQKNAETLRTANAEVRTQLERGVFDINVVKSANENLIATIEDSLRIADEGKKKRAEAEVTLQGLESELRSTLESASARKTVAS